jgi:F0F1-type ATP synthase assembly protein I
MNQKPERPSSERVSLARGEMAGMDQGMRVLSYLIAGVLVYGLLGWVGDHYLGTGFLLPLGIVLGAAGGCYVIIRRYGQVPQGPAVTDGEKTSADVTNGERVSAAVNDGDQVSAAGVDGDQASARGRMISDQTEGAR